MARSLRMKVTMFMALLLIAAMFVVGTFLVNGVRSFYVNSFFDQMSQVFTPEYIAELNEAGEESPARLKELLMATSSLGVDITSRNVYVLSTGGHTPRHGGTDRAEEEPCILCDGRRHTGRAA